jgi:hypothetical protein
MESAREFQQYAKECVESARTAATEEERETLLQMAKTWLAAALVAREREASSPSEPHYH